MLDRLNITHQKTEIKDKVRELLPDGNFNICLTCGACASGCPATAILDMDPRKFVRMATLGMDAELERNPWIWVCTMCKRCYDICPMHLNIPQLIYYIRSQWPREERPKGILGSCDHHLNSRGGAMAQDLRFVLKQVVGEDNFVDMTPNLSNNFCCGGGGGSLQSGLNNERHTYGNVKLNQIMATGADYVVTPCHNCHAQIEDLSHHFKAGYQTVHLWTLICLSMEMLGENERTYLGPDLADYGLE